MPFDAAGKWIPEDDSVISRLNGLLSSDSSYIQTARAAGQRTAQKRGLLNSSIAAGAAESAAIAAGAPLASQDAQQIAQKNQAVLEGGITLNNQTALQEKDFAGRTALLGSEAEITKQRDLLLQKGATEAQIREFDQRSVEQLRNIDADRQRQNETIASNERTALLTADTSLRNQQIAASSQLSGQYLSAFSTLAGDPNIPAAVRNAYISEFQRVLTQGQSLVGVLKAAPLTWNGTAAPGATTTALEPAFDPSLNTSLGSGVLGQYQSVL